MDLGSILPLIVFLLIGIISVTLDYFNKKLTDKKVDIPGSLIVICICAFLGYNLSFPGRLRSRAQGQYTYCQSNCKNLGSALEIYSTDNGGNYPDSLRRLAPNYIKTIPTCPAAKSPPEGTPNLPGNRVHAGGDSYSSSYQVFHDPKNPENNRYTFYCKGKNHTFVGAGENFPQYNSETGLMAR